MAFSFIKFLSFIDSSQSLSQSGIAANSPFTIDITKDFIYNAFQRPEFSPYINSLFITHLLVMTKFTSTSLISFLWGIHYSEILKAGKAFKWLLTMQNIIKECYSFYFSAYFDVIFHRSRWDSIRGCYFIHRSNYLVFFQFFKSAEINKKYIRIPALIKTLKKFQFLVEKCKNDVLCFAIILRLLNF